MWSKVRSISAARKRELAFFYRWRTARHALPYKDIVIHGRAELLWIARSHGWPLQGSHTVEWPPASAQFVADTSAYPPEERIVNLRGAILDAVDLSDLDFTGALLELCKFKKCTLKNTRFVRAGLQGATFTDTPLGTAVFLDDSEQSALISQRVPHRNLTPYEQASDPASHAPYPTERIIVLTRNELLWLLQRGVSARFLDLRTAQLHESDIQSFALTPVAMEPDNAGDILAQLKENHEAGLPYLAKVKIPSWQMWYWLRSTPLIDGAYRQTDPPSFDLREADLADGRFPGVDVHGANLSGAQMDGAHFEWANLREARLNRAHLNRVFLSYTNLSNASLRRAALANSHLECADLYEADLRKAHMENASLLGARLSVARLQEAHCRNADYRGVELRGAHVNASTSLIDITIDARTSWGDIVWHGIPLLDIDWTDIKHIGDEAYLEASLHSPRKKTAQERLDARRSQQRVFRDTTRAYHQLYVKLNEQGFYRISSRLRLREKALERQQLWRNKQFLAWLWSFVAWIMIGYGEKPNRLLYVYVAVVECWAALYLLIDHFASVIDHQPPALTSAQAVLLSLAALKGSAGFPKALLQQRVFGNLLMVFGLVETWVNAILVIAFTLLWTQRLLGAELPSLRSVGRSAASVAVQRGAATDSPATTRSGGLTGP